MKKSRFLFFIFASALSVNESNVLLFFRCNSTNCGCYDRAWLFPKNNQKENHQHISGRHLFRNKMKWNDEHLKVAKKFQISGIVQPKYRIKIDDITSTALTFIADLQYPIVLVNKLFIFPFWMNTNSLFLNIISYHLPAYTVRCLCLFLIRSLDTRSALT